MSARSWLSSRRTGARDWWDRTTATPFTHRDPFRIGLIGLIVIALALLVAMKPTILPFVGNGHTYEAYFSEAAGLRSGDDVRVAGVNVGRVKSVELDGTKVKVTFQVKDAFVGDESTASIGIKTLLGAKYLAIHSTGDQQLDEAIPLDRTEAPYDIYPAITDLTETFDKIDTDKLAKAFETLGTELRGTPAAVTSVTRGMTRLAETIASRDDQLRQLLAGANAVTGVLSDRDAQLTTLLSDGSALLDALHSRRDAVHSLLVNTAALSVQLQGIVGDNEKTIGPLLQQLHQVLVLLQKNQGNLDKSLGLLGPYYRLMNNVVGNGRWFDNYIQNFSAAGILSYPGLGG